MANVDKEAQMEPLEYVPPPPPGPERKYLFGNRLRWAAQVIRHQRYRRRLKQREALG
jgi:hypothetical protein